MKIKHQRETLVSTRSHGMQFGNDPADYWSYEVDLFCAMILTIQRDRDRNVKNNNASNFIKCFKISLIMRFDWHGWYVFVGKWIPHATKTNLLPQSEQV